MNIEELEIKLKIIKDAGIHCPTLELAKKVLDIFHKLGLKWCSDVSYIKCTNWDSYENNTVYYPFKGAFSSLEFAQEEGYKIISAEKFIASHTEEFNLENYEPKGELMDFPKEIIARILDYQEEQGNPRDISVFEKYKDSAKSEGGFNWDKTKEKDYFWHKVINNKNFNVFFEKYPKKEDTSQEFKVGDKVIDIISGLRGKIIDINTLNNSIFVDFDENEIAVFTLDGRDYSIDKYPRLLHYRDDYDYSVINFNNLPKKEEVKRWRAEKGELYYLIHLEDMGFCRGANLDKYNEDDNEYYEYGNYFKTEEEAQKIADQMNTYFQKIVKI